MNKTLYFFPVSYPFSFAKEESFIKDELFILSKSFNKIIIYPSILKGKLYDVPSSCEIKENYATYIYNVTRTKQLSKIIQVWFNKYFLKEFFTNFKHYLGIKKIFKLAVYAFILLKKKKWIEKNISPNKEDIFYTFWFTDITNALALSKIGKGNTLITRVHGIDLYEERSFANIPFRKSALREINLIATISEKGRDYLVKLYPNFSQNIKCNYLGIQSDKHFVTNISQNRVLRIVSCSSVIKIKRVDKIYNSLKILVQEHKISVEWTHIGGGKLFNELKEIAISNDFLKVNLLGNISHEQILNFYKNNTIDLFVHTSETEGLPMVMIEASSFGIPIISTNVGGVSEIVKEGKNGFLISSAAIIQEMCSSINRYFLLSEEEKLEMKMNSKQIWAEKFDSYNNAKKLLYTINEL